MGKNQDTSININFDEKKFKKYNGEHIEDIVEYIRTYVNGSKDIKIMVGCDSKQKRSITSYSIVIVLYDEFRNNGAHVIYIKVTTPRIKDLFTRLMNEATLSLSLSEWLDNKIEKFYNVPDFGLNEYDHSKPYKRIEIHVDVNPLEGLNKKNKSNMAYNAVMGMLCGSGFSVKSKPIAYAASTAADLLCQ